MMCTLQLGFMCFINHMVNFILHPYILQFIYIFYIAKKTLMFQQMIKNYIEFYSFLFLFNMFAHVHYKDSCIPMTLHTHHRKFIVNRHNFK
jgi:hypothetical protein